MTKYPKITTIQRCRICHSSNLFKFLSLGKMPPPNLFPKPDLPKREPFFPLDVCFCQNCNLVQLKHTVNPNLMFKDYIYVSSATQTMINHFENLARHLVKKFNLKSQHLVIDIGSNDGTLLARFKTFSVRTLGVDPAQNLVKVAQKKGVKNLPVYFQSSTAQKIKNQYGTAQIITATNVVAHVHDLHDFFEGVKILLDKKGVFVAEFPYLIDLLQKKEFDTIYHEHLSYFSVKPLLRLIESHNLELFNVEKLAIHGGSIRIYVSFAGQFSKNTANINKLLELEKRENLQSLLTYTKFASFAYQKRQHLRQLLKNLKKSKKRIVGYGAAAKGNIFLNFVGIGNETLDYVVDSTDEKQGRLTPGTHIPISSESLLIKDKPDFALILAWNFAEEIISKNRQFQKRGGKFILTTPKIQII